MQTGSYLDLPRPAGVVATASPITNSPDNGMILTNVENIFPL